MLLRHKTIGGICLFLSAVVVFGALQYHQGNERVRIQGLLQRLTVDHMQADMAHDAVRGDVYAFLYAVQRGGAEVREAALQDLSEHGGQLINTLKKELSASPSSLIAAAIRDALADADDYVKGGRELIGSHSAWGGAQNDVTVVFNEKFEKLESSMEKITELYQAHADATDEALKRQMLFLQLAALAVIGCCLAAPWVANRYVFLPILRLAEKMERMRNGVYDDERYGVDREDEIGKMAAALRHFAKAEAERQALREQAEGRSRAAEAARIHQANTAAALERELKAVIAALAAASERMSVTSISMSDSATRSKALTSEAESEAERAAECVSSVAVLTAKLSASAQAIARQIRRTNELVRVSREKVETADKAGQLLSDAAARVERALDAVSGISSQINMLALNAGIESGRAGELGRGFAVVAGEVKNLAHCTHLSINEIREVMTGMRAAGGQIRETLGDIALSVGSIAEAAEEVAAATDEQTTVTAGVAGSMNAAASGVLSVSEGLRAAGEASRSVDEAAGEIKSAAGSLTHHAEKLEKQMAVFLKESKVA